MSTHGLSLTFYGVHSKHTVNKAFLCSEYAAFMILEAETMSLLDFDARDLRGC